VGGLMEEVEIAVRALWIAILNKPPQNWEEWYMYNRMVEWMTDILTDKDSILCDDKLWAKQRRTDG